MDSTFGEGFADRPVECPFLSQSLTIGILTCFAICRYELFVASSEVGKVRNEYAPRFVPTQTFPLAEAQNARIMRFPFLASDTCRFKTFLHRPESDRGRFVRYDICQSLQKGIRYHFWQRQRLEGKPGRVRSRGCLLCLGRSEDSQHGGIGILSSVTGLTLVIGKVTASAFRMELGCLRLCFLSPMPQICYRPPSEDRLEQSCRLNLWLWNWYHSFIEIVGNFL